MLLTLEYMRFEFKQMNISIVEDHWNLYISKRLYLSVKSDVLLYLAYIYFGICRKLWILFVSKVDKSKFFSFNIIDMTHPRSTIFLIFVCFLVVCTFCEVRLRQLTTADDEKKPHQENSILATLSKFSLRKNAAAILSTRVRRESLPAIHGIRFISMAWVVLGHQYITPLFGANVNMLRVMDVSTHGVFIWWDNWLMRERVAKTKK